MMGTLSLSMNRLSEAVEHSNRIREATLKELKEMNKTNKELVCLVKGAMNINNSMAKIEGEK